MFAVMCGLNAPLSKGPLPQIDPMALAGFLVVRGPHLLCAQGYRSSSR